MEFKKEGDMERRVILQRTQTDFFKCPKIKTQWWLPSMPLACAGSSVPWFALFPLCILTPEVDISPQHSSDKITVAKWHLCIQFCLFFFYPCPRGPIRYKLYMNIVEGQQNKKIIHPNNSFFISITLKPFMNFGIFLLFV